MPNLNVTAFTAALKSNFWQAWEETAEPAPNDPFTIEIGSTTRIENYPNWTPAPAMQEWDGTNDYGTMSSYVYQLENRTYRAAVMIRVQDLDDDQTGALVKKPQELATKAKYLKSREVMKCLAAGQTGTFTADGTVYGPSFDGLNFFANRTGTNGFGTGNNLLSSYTTLDHSSGSGTANTTYNLIALYHGPMTKTLKPMVWQNRSGPKFMTNVGTPQEDESMQARMWATLRGRAGYGIWYNAVWQPFLGLPNVSEIQIGFQAMEAAFRTFQLPKSRSTSFGEYLFEQTTFNTNCLTMAGSTALATVLRQALNQDWAPQSLNISGAVASPVATSNQFKGFAGYLVSNYLN